MRRFTRTSLLLLGSFLVISGCVLPTISIVDPNAQATSLAQTVQALVVASQRASGLTLTPTFPSPAASYTPVSPTWTLVPTLTASLTPTTYVLPTITPPVAEISVSVPTNCREGPGKAYPIVGALLVGETVEVYATDPTYAFWYIHNPDSPFDFCWVWGQYATLTGPTGSLPVYTPMPTPTPTATATPAPGFDAAYEGLVSCPGAWWTEIALENTGTITFRSAEIIVKDTVTSETSDDLTDGFVDRPDCSTTHSRATLLPGKNVVISSSALPSDPTGHKLRATITLCSNTGQEGLCATRSITFKP